ncbi:HD domain-containing protein [Clostridium hydrogenum]|uniref:HD domain-containing protein n=1 Tax=Clostridium hydrogenum TaxID=2855764 RepID=UPI001F3CBA24|nr:HD domain-containing protein [Clostridium hydrogenum]
MFKRIKQFYNYMTANVDAEDKMYLDKCLNTDERNLFDKLSVHEQKHSINVAKDVENICDKNSMNSSNLVKAALMHDIGKLKAKMNIIEKSIIVILDNISKGRIKRFTKLEKIYVYYNHPDDGAKILEELNENSRILYLIRNHHNKSIKDDLELSILKICDDRN